MVEAPKSLSAVVLAEQGGDGFEPIGGGDFIITAYIGLIYYVTKKGDLQLHAGYKAENIGAADIAYDVARRLVYVPTLFRKSAAAYHLK